MFTYIAGAVPRFQQYEKLFPDNRSLVEAMSNVYLHIIEFCMKAKDVFKGPKRGWRRLARVSGTGT